MSNTWPKGLDPRGFTPDQKQFIRINERVRQLEEVVKNLKGKKAK